MKSPKNNIPQKNGLFSGIKSQIRKAYERFLRIRGNPREIALGFALGIFVGMTPFMGLHAVTAVFFAALLKWNKISAAVGVFITNPFTAPFFYGITYWIGSFVYCPASSEPVAGAYDMGMLLSIVRKAPDILLTLVIGGVILGIPLAILAYYMSYSAIMEYRLELKEKLKEKTAKIAKNRPRLKKKKKK